tara:strand:+ start:449 stop:655 length:207 start_codon:yes stop_codon:yes gene_type:complete
METEEIILIIVSVHLILKLISNFSEANERKLLFAYLENNERDRLAIIRETIPDIENDLAEIKYNTKNI